MSTALPAVTAASLVTGWLVAPLALAAVVAAGGWYARSVRRLRGRGARWPARRSITFGLGLALFGWITCGFLQDYATSLYWVWTTQTLALLLVVPFVILLGQPIQLARASGGEHAPLNRVMGTRVVRTLANPLIGPAVVPLLSVVLFFGPLAGWAIRFTVLGWVLQLALVGVGAMLVLPLVGLEDEPSSLAVGLSMAIGSFELILDAVPGIVLRLSSATVTGYFSYRHAHGWSPSAIHDQRLAGAILWCVSEVIDLPFLLLVFRRWVRVDARDAQRIDAVLDAERIAAGHGGDDEAVPTDEPWWLSDQQMRRRLGR